MALNHEEEMLRSVALQNASSIMLARRQAEEALRHANQSLEQKTQQLAHSLSLLRATLEATTDAILVTDAGGRITDFNEKYVHMWGLAPVVAHAREHKQLLQHLSQYFPKPETFLARINEIYSTSPPEAFDVLELSDGRYIERFSKAQLVDGEYVGRVWSFRDITERRQTDEARFRLAAVVESSDDAIVSKTLHGIVTTWNVGAERIFGYMADEMLGKSITKIIPPERLNEEAMILERLRRGERIKHYETVRVKKDGTRFDVSITVSPIRDASGKIIGASKIARDITERKRAIEEREQLLDAERAARTEAERMSIMKDEFLATLSHELRTPLSAILGWSQLLSSGNVEEGELREGLDAIERNARAQTQLIEDLLDMSRIVSGKIRLDVQWIDLPSIVDLAVESVRPSADARQIRLRKIIDPNAGPVSGDPTRLQQIVWNLLTNAIKFTPKGGTVDAVVERVNSHVEVTIRDTGIGIKPEFLPLVFERFRQADSSTTRSYSGLGLGLSIVKNLTELHGGSVRAESAGEKQGAAFIVKLPIAPIRSGEKREHPTTSTRPTIDWQNFDLAGVRVLVIDDEPDGRNLIKRVLDQCDAHVITAANAEQGLQLLRSETPNIIVSDIGMPGTDGYQFIREVRRLPAEEGGRTPAVAVTAFARSEDRTRAMMSGYQVHIAKPIEPQELVVTVASLAGRTGHAE